MLRGTRADYIDDGLSSLYGLEKGVEIVAEIDVENETTKIFVNGLRKISGLARANNLSNVNQTNASNLITGNFVDEVIPETSLDDILTGEPTVSQPNEPAEGQETKQPNESQEIDLVGIGNINVPVNETQQETGNATSNETVTGQDSLEFTLYSTDEDYVIGQVAFVTDLSLSDVKKLIRFDYKNPENFVDEVVESLPQSVSYPDFVEKVNGTVIIRVG